MSLFCNGTRTAAISAIQVFFRVSGLSGWVDAWVNEGRGYNEMESRRRGKRENRGKGERGRNAVRR